MIPFIAWLIAYIFEQPREVFGSKNLTEEDEEYEMWAIR